VSWNTAVEDADYSYNSGRERSVPATAQKCQLVAQTYTEIPGQYRADNNFGCAEVAEKTAFLDQPGNVRNTRFEQRFDPEYLNTKASFLARGERESGAACRDVFEFGVFTIDGGKRPYIRHALAHLLIIYVARRLDLQMPAEGLQRVIDHHVVHAELNRHHEHQQRIGKYHCSGC
jgi:hypothetical protein